ncbi:MAG: hypothetical protein ABEJ36_01530 [Candidatus Nanosalina sp.]
MNRKAGIVVFAFSLGILLGGNLAHVTHVDEEKSRNFCSRVESGIEANMTEGFVNCYPPGVLSVNLTETVEEKSDLKCVCRKKVDGVVETISLSVSN